MQQHPVIKEALGMLIGSPLLVPGSPFPALNKYACFWVGELEVSENIHVSGLKFVKEKIMYVDTATNPRRITFVHENDREVARQMEAVTGWLLTIRYSINWWRVTR